MEPATRTCNRLPTIISNFSFQLAVRFYSRYFFAKTTSITGGVVRATVTLGPVHILSMVFRDLATIDVNVSVEI